MTYPAYRTIGEHLHEQARGSSWGDAVRTCDHPPHRLARLATRSRHICALSLRQDVRWEAERALADAIAAYLQETR